jgi:hypothetical protein
MFFSEFAFYNTTGYTRKLQFRNAVPTALLPISVTIPHGSAEYAISLTASGLSGGNSLPVVLVISRPPLYPGWITLYPLGTTNNEFTTNSFPEDPWVIQPGSVSWQTQ